MNPADVVIQNLLQQINEMAAARARDAGVAAEDRFKLQAEIKRLEQQLAPKVKAA